MLITQCPVYLYTNKFEINAKFLPLKNFYLFRQSSRTDEKNNIAMHEKQSLYLGRLLFKRIICVYKSIKKWKEAADY